MTEREFIFWLKGYLAAKSDSNMKGDILYMLSKVEDKKIGFSGTLSEPFQNTIKWANSNSDIWFENKSKNNGPVDHLS